MSTGDTGKRARVQIDTLRTRLAFVEETFGVEARQRYVSEMSPALRQLLIDNLKPAGGWVDFDLLIEATLLSDRLFGNGDCRLAFDMGRFAAKHEVGVWKGFIMRHIRPATILTLAGGVWSRHYEGGRLASRTTGDSSLVVALLDFPQPHPAHCLAIAGWMLGSLEMGPRRETQVDEVGCRTRGAAACEFRLSWKAS